MAHGRKADLCDCLINDLCVGAMAGIQEVDKVRTIFDATIIGVDDNIRANTDKKTTAPTLYDLLFAKLHLLDADLTLFKSDVSPSQVQGAQEALEVYGGQDQGQVLGQQGGHVWCGLGAALLGPIGDDPHALVLSHLGHVLVFVDDFVALMPAQQGDLGAATLMLFLTLVGCPISWHKNVLGKKNRWLGYMVDISNGSVWLPDDKLATLLPALKKLEAGDLHVRKEITSVLGKLQWVAKAYPQVSPHLQPLYAWEKKLERKCRPGDLVRFLATLLLTILNSGPAIPLRLQSNAPGRGSSDAGEDNDRVAISGWYSTSPNPKKEDVFWFSMDAKQTPWAQARLAHTSAKRRIGTLEMLGSLVLFMLAAEFVCPSMLEIHLPFTTGSEGNAYSTSKRSSKKWPCSALLIELSAQDFQKGVFAHVTHVKRCSNTWADQLTHFNFDGFSMGNRKDVSSSWT